jgi:hypothetical protein
MFESRDNLKAGAVALPRRNILAPPAAGGRRADKRHTDGVLGDRPLSDNARCYHPWLLRTHLLPLFGTRRLDAIDRDLCLDLNGLGSPAEEQMDTPGLSGNRS